MYYDDPFRRIPLVSPDSPDQPQCRGNDEPIGFIGLLEIVVVISIGFAILVWDSTGGKFFSHHRPSV